MFSFCSNAHQPEQTVKSILSGYWSNYVTICAPTGPASQVRKMVASCNDCGGGLRFDITDRGCTFRLAFEGLAMGPLIAGSHRRNCRTRLLLVPRSIEQRT